MWRASLLVLAACGRLGFDAGVVQTVSGESSSATQLVLSLPMPRRTGDRNNTAYTFAQSPGTYSAVWNDPTAGSYCAASAVFKP